MSDLFNGWPEDGEPRPRMTEAQKRAQLERRGWSERRIRQYMRDWRFHIPPTKSPHGRNREKDHD